MWDRRHKIRPLGDVAERVQTSAASSLPSSRPAVLLCPRVLQYVHHFSPFYMLKKKKKSCAYSSSSILAQHCPYSLWWYCSVWLPSGNFQTRYESRVQLIGKTLPHVVFKIDALIFFPS